MGRDKTKIFADNVNVWIAATGTGGAPADATNFTEVGWCEAGQTKFSSSARNNVDLHDNTPHHLNSQFKLELMGLETDNAKITALEAFENSSVDIVLSKVGDEANGYQLTGMVLAVETDMTFDSKTPLKLKLSATVTAKKVSDVFSETTGMLSFT